MPRWSPGGQRLLFWRAREPDGVVVDSLWHATATGKRIRRIPLGMRVVLEGYDWAPNGRRVVFAARAASEPARDPMLYTIALDGTRRRQLRPGCGRHGRPAATSSSPVACTAGQGRQATRTPTRSPASGLMGPASAG